MKEAEILSMKKVGPAEAARYLQNGTTAQQIRVWAKSGCCPFCQAVKLPGASKRMTYRVHIANLIAYKTGAELVPMPRIGYGTEIGRERHGA